MEWMFRPLRKYAVFSGRAPRREFWMWVLFLVIAEIVLSLLDGALGLGGSNQFGKTQYGGPGVSGVDYGGAIRGGILANLFGLAVLIPNLAVSVRRLHDTDHSGWWILLPIVPSILIGVLALAGGTILILFASLLVLVSAVLLLFWYCSRGTVGPNRFGADPYAGYGDLEETFR